MFIQGYMDYEQSLFHLVCNAWHEWKPCKKGQRKIFGQEEVSFSLLGLFASLFCMFFFVSSIAD